MLNIKVTIGIEEYLDFHRLFFKVNKVVKKELNKARLIGPVFLLLLFFFLQFKEEGIWLPILIFVLLAILWICLIPVYVKWRSLRRLKNKALAPGAPDIFGERELFFKEDAIQGKTPDEEAEFEWHSFIGFKESRNIFLLFMNQSQVIIIPKKQITPEQEERIREILQQKINQTI